MKRIIVIAMLVGTVTLFPADGSGRAATEVEDEMRSRFQAVKKHKEIREAQQREELFKEEVATRGIARPFNTDAGDHLEASDLMDDICSRAMFTEQAKKIKEEAAAMQLAAARPQHEKIKPKEPQRTRSLPSSCSSPDK